MLISSKKTYQIIFCAPDGTLPAFFSRTKDKHSVIFGTVKNLIWLFIILRRYLYTFYTHFEEFLYEFLFCLFVSDAAPKMKEPFLQSIEPKHNLTDHVFFFRFAMIFLIFLFESNINLQSQSASHIQKLMKFQASKRGDKNNDKKERFPKSPAVPKLASMRY